MAGRPQPGYQAVVEPALLLDQDPLPGDVLRPAGHAPGGGDLQARDAAFVGGLGQRPAVAGQQAQHGAIGEAHDGAQSLDAGLTGLVDQRLEHDLSEPGPLVAVEHGHRQLGDVPVGGYVPGLGDEVPGLARQRGHDAHAAWRLIDAGERGHLDRRGRPAVEAGPERLR